MNKNASLLDYRSSRAAETRQRFKVRPVASNGSSLESTYTRLPEIGTDVAAPVIEGMARIVALIKEGRTLESIKTLQEVRLNHLQRQAQLAGLALGQLKAAHKDKSKWNSTMKLAPSRLLFKEESSNTAASKQQKLDRLMEQISGVRRRLTRIPHDFEDKHLEELLKYQLEAEAAKTRYLKERVQLIEKLLPKLNIPFAPHREDRSQVFDVIKKNNGTSSTKTFTWNNPGSLDDSRTYAPKHREGSNTSSLPILQRGKRGEYSRGLVDNKDANLAASEVETGYPGDVFDQMRGDSAKFSRLVSRSGKNMRLDSMESNQTLTQGLARFSSPEGNSNIGGKFHQKLPKLPDSIVQRADRSSVQAVLQTQNEPKQGLTPESRKSVPRTSSLDPLTYKISKDSVSSKDQQIATPRIGESVSKSANRTDEPVLSVGSQLQPAPVPEIGFFRRSLFSEMIEPKFATNSRDSMKKSAGLPFEQRPRDAQHLLSAVPALVKKREVNQQIALPKPGDRKAPLLVLITEQLFKPPEPSLDPAKMAEPQSQPRPNSSQRRGGEVVSFASGTAGVNAHGSEGAGIQAATLGNAKLDQNQASGLIGDSFWKTALQSSAKPAPKPVQSSPQVPGDQTHAIGRKDGSETAVISKFLQAGSKTDQEAATKLLNAAAPNPAEWPKRPTIEFARTETKKLTIPMRDPENEDWIGLDRKTKIKLSELWNQPSDEESEDSPKYGSSELRPQFTQEVVYPNPIRMRSKRHSTSNWFGGDSSRSYLNKSSVRFH